MQGILYFLLLFAQVKDVHFPTKVAFPSLKIAQIDSSQQWHWETIDSLQFPKNPKSPTTLFANRLIGKTPILHQYWDFYLDSTHQSFKLLSDSLLKIFPKKPYKMRYVSEYRSLALQEQLLQKGKSKLPLSLHNFGFALDVGIYRKKKYLRKSPMYQHMGEKAKSIGLFWGGDFVGFPDPGHIQYYPNTAAFLEQFPLVGFEFLRYKGLFEDNYQSALEKGRINLVQDTKQLIDQLNRNFPELSRISRFAISIPSNPHLRSWLQENFAKSQYTIIYHPSERWIYLQKGEIGYFWGTSY